VEKRFASEEADVPNTATVQNFQGGVELFGVDPSQIFADYLAIREIAEITRGIARVGHSNIA
jgi:hypothetical protein